MFELLRNKAVSLTLVALILLLGIVAIFRSVEYLDGSHYMVVASLNGEFACYVTPGFKSQALGDYQKYPIRGIYEFADQEVRFNDSGKALMSGSIQYQMPADCEALTKIYRSYHSPAAVQDSLVRRATDKAVGQVGQLLSSRESYAEKKNDLIFWIADQTEHGIYKTKTQEVKIKDVTGEERIAPLATIVIGKDGLAERQEKAVIEEFNIHTFNFTMRIKYSNEVELQAAEQQKLAMAVETSMLAARKAEQGLKTAEAEGKTSVTIAKYEKETEKVRAVVMAEQEKDVALTNAERDKQVSKLERDAAEFVKQRLILEGQGESEKRKAMMTADNALDKRGEIYLKANAIWADAIAKHQNRLTPDTMIINGSSAGVPHSSAIDLMEMFKVNVAKNLSFDPTLGGAKSK